MSCGRENIILGLSWLQTTNSTIDWSHQTISISESCNQSKDLHSIYTTDTEYHNAYFQKSLLQTPRHVNMDTVTNKCLYEFLYHKTEDQFITQAKRNWALYRIIWGDSCFILGSPVMARLTTAMELTATAEKAKPPVVLLKKFLEFAEVFSKEATNHVPPSWPYDHKINLDKTFVPKIGKIYLLSPDEKKATEDFLKKNLALEKIHPFNSPKPSLSSLSKEGRETPPLPRLSLSEWAHHPRCLSSPSHFWPCWQTQGCETFHQIQCLMRVQQCLH